MPVDLRWRPRASQDLIEIYEAVAAESEAAADRFIARVEERCALLRAFPRLGKRRPDIAAGMRVVPEWPYLMIYEVHPPERNVSSGFVEIVRVVDGRRNLTRLSTGA